jgi:predicted HAD superfamily phosphohydrolase YqeG
MAFPWRRSHHVVVGHLDEVAALVGTGPDGLVLVFDVDGTIVPQGAPDEAYRKRVGEVIERFESATNVSRVQVITNGPDRGVPGVISQAGKPWVGRDRLGLSRHDEVWVIGDQVISDGVLARRLGARFIQLAVLVEGEPAAQARMRRWGRLVRPLILRADDQSDRSS